MKNYKSKWKEPSPPRLGSRCATAELTLLETSSAPGWGCPPEAGGAALHPQLQTDPLPQPTRRGDTAPRETRALSCSPDAPLLRLPLLCPELPADVVRMATFRRLSPKVLLAVWEVVPGSCPGWARQQLSSCPHKWQSAWRGAGGEGVNIDPSAGTELPSREWAEAGAGTKLGGSLGFPFHLHTSFSCSSQSINQRAWPRINANEAEAAQLSQRGGDPLQHPAPAPRAEVTGSPSEGLHLPMEGVRTLGQCLSSTSQEPSPPAGSWPETSSPW